jgi:hypothetical protein
MNLGKINLCVSQKIGGVYVADFQREKHEIQLRKICVNEGN